MKATKLLKFNFADFQHGKHGSLSNLYFTVTKFLFIYACVSQTKVSFALNALYSSRQKSKINEAVKIHLDNFTNSA